MSMLSSSRTEALGFSLWLFFFAGAKTGIPSYTLEVGGTLLSSATRVSQRRRLVLAHERAIVSVLERRRTTLRSTTMTLVTKASK